jgi:hypothetical protein
MTMEPVRILLNQDGTKGLLLSNADLESFARIIADFMGAKVRIGRGWLVKTMMVYGFDCVLYGDRLYPVIDSPDGGFLKVRYVDLTETVVLDGGEER